MALKRRSFIKTAVAAGSVAMLPKVAFAVPSKCIKRRVVVIGGGFAGATAAKYMKLWDADLDVTLIERNAQFVSCPQSNLVLGGNRSLQQLTHDYQGLNKQGVTTVQAEVVAIDTDKQKVRLHDDVDVGYDRLVIAPGIDFIYDDLPMLASYEAQQKVPHAWKAGPQTTLLKQQLHTMKQGGTMVMTVPMGPLRCPPGPYERACQVAYYLKHNNPTAKLIVLDANADIMSKKGLFRTAWQQHYADLIEYIPSSAIEDVDVNILQVESEFDSYTADVLNVIPPQRAGKVAEMAGVINVDERWCKVDFLTYESTDKKNVHIIGDAIAAKLPKSGHMANAQAKVCAAAVVSLLKEQLPEQEPVINNTCYSFVDDKQAVHVAAVYRYDKEQAAMIAMPGGGVSKEASELEGAYADAWAQNIWADSLK
ncbi:flavocytochrome C [Methylophaga sp. 42_25_T18]|nr:flavocytochrome C [Methylophaga sp. 42_25_T18]OUR89767.1 flavocytochrome C [Methylophaga sp. 42_8_T64]